ncbi:MAG TPA: multicopper oxidase domain-containing protein [Gemmatimonadaceae bacterium]|nr:multicopper oxidase domain-containing protein [Gemmatimonadaceae bacterium]
MTTPSIKLAAAPLFALLASSAATPRAPETVRPNDNRHTAGVLANRVLTLKLEARTGVWYPEGEAGRALDAAAFAEVGKPLSTPGPLIRVPVGTDIHASIHNTLDKPLTVFGFGATRGMSDSVVIAPDETKEVAFKAEQVGTFYYMGRRDLEFGIRRAIDTQLGGAIVVDPPNARPNDRILVISWSFTVDPTSPTGLGRGTMAINGLSWPHTERLDLVQGDSVHWRVVNLTESDHPMHLHGFYFRVDAKGNGVTDSLYDHVHQRMAVTEVVNPGETFALSWLPSRPGNWIFHCHYAAHLSNLVALDNDRGSFDESMVSHHMSDRPHQMYGLVMGIRVAPHGPVARSAIPPRAIRLEVRERKNVYGSQSAYAFVMNGTPDASDSTAMPVPGPALILERGKPVAVTIVNHASDHAAVHWHGIELESYPDGVPGWSGSGDNILPSIKPGDSITVRFTPPRAGTFMYHSHFNEAQQMGGGLYGPIIVLDSGQKFDAETDKVLFFGTAGAGRNVIFGPFPNDVMNGQVQPEAMNLKVGTRYRFRLLNLAGDAPLFFSLDSGDKPITWRAIAKDGYALPESQATVRPATLLFDPGEIYDFEYTPRAAGELALRFGYPPPPPGSPPPPPPVKPPPPPVTVAIHVR